MRIAKRIFVLIVLTREYMRTYSHHGTNGSKRLRLFTRSGGGVVGIEVAVVFFTVAAIMILSFLGDSVSRRILLSNVILLTNIVSVVLPVLVARRTHKRMGSIE